MRHVIRALALALFLLCISQRAALALVISSDTIIDYEVPASVGDVFIQSPGPESVHVQFVEGSSVFHNVIVNDHSHVTVDGAIFRDSVFVHDQSVVDFLDGIISDDEDLEASESSVVNIYGGVFADDVDAKGNSVINLYGGSFERALDGGELTAQVAATVNIFGSNLQFLPSRFPVDPRYQYVVGTLFDGTPIDIDVWSTDDARILVHNIPEPTSAHIALIACVFLSGCFRWHANRGHGNEKHRIGPSLFHLGR